VSIYRFISAEKARTPVSMCCELLGVSRSGYYDWLGRPPSDRALTDVWLIEKIKEIHAGARGVYGARRIHAELRLAHGIAVGRGLSGEVCLVVVIDHGAGCRAGRVGSPGGASDSAGGRTAREGTTHHHEHHEARAAPRFGRRS